MNRDNGNSNGKRRGGARPSNQNREQDQPARGRGRKTRGQRKARGGGQPASAAPPVPVPPVAQGEVPGSLVQVVQATPVPPVVPPEGVQTPTPAPVKASPAKAVKKKPTVEEVARDALRKYKLRVPENLALPASRIGVAMELLPPTAETPNPHDMLALLRQLTEFYGFVDLVKRGHRVIDCWFGSAREGTVVRFLNNLFVKAGYEENYIKIQSRHGAVIPLDYGRRPEEPPMGTQFATAAIFMDVYCHGSTEKPVEITPDWISTLPYEEIVWSGHHFPGYYGAVLSAAWINRNGQILWSPDDINPVYPPHPPCSLMHTHGANGLFAWKIARTVGVGGKLVYNLVHFYRSTLVSTPLMAYVDKTKEKSLAIPDFNKILVDETSWFAFINKPLIEVVRSGVISPLLPLKTVRFNLAHFQEVLAFLAPRHVNGYTYAALVQRIQSILASDQDWTLVNQRFPEFFGNYAEDLALAAIIDRAVVRSATLTTVRDAFAGTFRQYTESVKNINDPQPRTLATTLFSFSGYALPFLGLLGLSKFLPSRPAPVHRSSYRPLCSWLTAAAAPPAPLDKLYGNLEGPVRNFFNRAVDTVLTRLNLFSVWDRFVDTVSNGITLTLAGQYSYSEAQVFNSDVRTAYFYGAVIGAPIIEEGCKRIGPSWMRHCTTAIIAWGDLAKAGGATPYDFVRQFAIHSVLRSFPQYWQSMVAHALFNLSTLYYNGRILEEAISRERVIESGEVLRTAMMANKWLLLAAPLTAYAVHRLWSSPQAPNEHRNPTLELLDEINKTGRRHPSVPGRIDWVSLTSYPVEQAFFPSQEIGEYPLPQLDSRIAYSVHLEPQRLDEARDGFYRWFVHPIPLFRPNNSTWNMLQMCQFRLLREVPPADDEEWYYLSLLSTLALSRAIDFHDNGLFRDYDSYKVCAAMGVHEWNNSKKKPGPKTDRLVLKLLVLVQERSRKALRYPVERFPITTPFGYFTSRQLEYSNEGPYVALFPEIALSDELWAQWLAHVEPRNVKLYQRARDELVTGPLDPKASVVLNTQVNQKRDEVLIKIEEYDAEGNLVEKGPVSRPIHAVDKKPTVEIGPYVYEATERIKAILFNYNVGEIGLTKIYWTWGAGRTDLELTLWWDFVMNNEGWHLIVAGDDMLLVHVRLHSCPHQAAAVTFFEGDLSQCDHTSRLGCLFAEYALQVTLGVPIERIALQVANARSKLTIGNRNQVGERIEIFRSYERNTGGTDTTFGNSSTSLLAATYAVLNAARPIHKCRCCYTTLRPMDSSRQDFIDCYATLGLVLKLRVTEFPTMDSIGLTARLPTFLKGTWYPSEPHNLEGRVIERVWGPLPSRLLKMGKTLNDPRVTMRMTGEGPISLETGLRRFAGALAYSMKDFMWPFGIKRWLVRLAPQSPPPVAKSVLTDSYVLQQISGSFPRSAATTRANAEMAVFYEVQPNVWTDFMDHLQEIKPMTLSEHPMWFALAKDYA